MNEIRFDLEDVLEANLGDDLFNLINIMKDRIQFKEIKFWYNGNINDKKVDNFIEKGKTIISSIPIRFSKNSPQMEFAWFDVISDIKSNGSRCRFSYIYPANKKSELIRGLYNFLNVVNFIELSGQGRRIYYKPKDNVGL